MSDSPGRIRIGIGGWVYPPWRETFYPKGLAQRLELAYAARHLGTIEINATFHGPQRPTSFERWRDETPPDFVFAVKGPKFATNRRALRDAGGAIDRFFATGVTRLGPKLGPINWQLPSSKPFDVEDCAAFLDLLPREVDGIALRHALEVRHQSFLCPEFITLARDRQVAIVVSGDSDYPLIGDPTADFIYVRMLGTVESSPAGYPPKALARWADRLGAWAQGRAPQEIPLVMPEAFQARDLSTGGRKGRRAQTPGRDVFAFVIAGAKARNPAAAMALIARCGGGTGALEPPHATAKAGGKQERLA